MVVDIACTSSTVPPLAEGATCDSAPGKQHVEVETTFGGELGASYLLELRVRGIWEPTNITGGAEPQEGAPFSVGGMVLPGSGDSASINYAQYMIEVESPRETYFLNDYNHVGHEIHKEDYPVTLPVDGGAKITVIVNDGNERIIANFPGEHFADVAPYEDTPSLGQLLRLDVLSVEAASAD